MARGSECHEVWGGCPRPRRSSMSGCRNAPRPADELGSWLRQPKIQGTTSELKTVKPRAVLHQPDHGRTRESRKTERQSNPDIPCTAASMRDRPESAAHEGFASDWQRCAHRRADSHSSRPAQPCLPQLLIARRASPTAATPSEGCRACAGVRAALLAQGRDAHALGAARRVLHGRGALSVPSA